MTTAHHPLGASSASRWMVCPGSVRLSEGIPDQQSAYAQEGTAAHHLAEVCLQNGLDALQIPDGFEVRFGAEWPEEMREHVQGFLDYVRALTPACVADPLFYEAKVDLGPWIPGCFGTVDFAVLDTDQNLLHVVDLKYGQGRRVSAVRNPQLMMYSLGILAELEHLFEIEDVKMHIFQPRVGPPDVYQGSVADLYEWADKELVPAARATEAEDAPLVPGESQCFFCRARNQCPARAAANQALARLDFDEQLAAPELMTLEEIAELLPHLDELKRWATDLQDFALKQAEAGERIPGYKLVEGRSNRVWAFEEADTRKHLHALGLTVAQITTSKLVGIPVIEKLLGGPKKAQPHIEALIMEPPGKPTLVPETDPREALSSANSARNDFAE